MENRISKLEQIKNRLDNGNLFYDDVVHPTKYNHRKGSRITPHTIFISPREGSSLMDFFDVSDGLKEVEGLHQMFPGIWYAIDANNEELRFETIWIQEYTRQSIAQEQANELREGLKK